MNTVRVHVVDAWVLALMLALCGLVRTARAAPMDQPPAPATVNGQVVDDTGGPIMSAVIRLSSHGAVPQMEVTSGADGRFVLPAVPDGPFEITVVAPGFATQTVSGVAASGGVTDLPPIRLRLAVDAISVDVTPSIVEIAEQQMREQEEQRVFGFVPNFFVSFNPEAARLNVHQKSELWWKAHIDPVQFAFVGVVAGVEQWRNDFPAFGEGASGYAKRYAALYATVWTRSMMTQVVMPTVFKQDPRYFYKGTGSTGARLGYALSRSVIRKGDNGHWQPNYSGILGSVTGAAISNFYYPAESRRGAGLMMKNTTLGIVAGAIGYVAQEFLLGPLTSRGGGAPKSPHRATRAGSSLPRPQHNRQGEKMQGQLVPVVLPELASETLPSKTVRHWRGFVRTPEAVWRCPVSHRVLQDLLEQHERVSRKLEGGMSDSTEVEVAQPCCYASRSMSPSTRLVVLAALACFAASCSSAPAPDLKAEESALRAADEQWAATAKRHDLDGTVAFYTNDAVLLPPNAPIATDAKSIRENWAELTGPNVAIDWKPSKVEVARSGDLGYIHGTYTLSIKDPKGGPAADERGKFVEVWKKQADGKWKCIVDTFNSDMPLPAAPEAKQ